MQARARHVGHVFGAVTKAVGHRDFLPCTPLLEFMFDAEPVIILIPVVPRIKVIGLAIYYGAGFAGECGRRGKREKYRNGNEGYKESFLHASIVRSMGARPRPRRSPATS